EEVENPEAQFEIEDLDLTLEVVGSCDRKDRYGQTEDKGNEGLRQATRAIAEVEPRKGIGAERIFEEDYSSETAQERRRAGDRRETGGAASQVKVNIGSIAFRGTSGAMQREWIGVSGHDSCWLDAEERGPVPGLGMEDQVRFRQGFRAIDAP